MNQRETREDIHSRRIWEVLTGEMRANMPSASLIDTRLTIYTCPDDGSNIEKGVFLGPFEIDIDDSVLPSEYTKAFILFSGYEHFENDTCDAKHLA